MKTRRSVFSYMRCATVGLLAALGCFDVTLVEDRSKDSSVGPTTSHGSTTANADAATLAETLDGSTTTLGASDSADARPEPSGDAGTSDGADASTEPSGGTGASDSADVSSEPSGDTGTRSSETSSSDETSSSGEEGCVAGECSCGPGLKEDGASCVDIDDCAGDPCAPGVECSDRPAPDEGYTCAPCVVPVHFDSIQAAVGEVRCREIQVEAGTYVENLIIDRDVIIVSAAGAGADVVLDGGGLGSVVTIKTGEVVLQGLTITGGSATRGAGIHNVGRLVLERTTVRANVGQGDGAQGAGIYSTGGLNLRKSSVIGNTLSGAGAIGAGIATTGTLRVVEDSLVGNNSIESGLGESMGGGIWASNAEVVIEDSKIVGNTVTVEGPDGVVGRGGGIYVSGGTLSVERSAIIDNVAAGRQTSSSSGDVSESAGGGLAAYQTTVEFVDVDVSRNTSAATGSGLPRPFGGGTALFESGLTATRTVFADNLVQGSGGTQRGGGLYALAEEAPQSILLLDVAILRNLVSGNHDEGGGAFVEGRVVFRARGLTVAEHSPGVPGSGGALRLDNESAPMASTLSNCTLSGNTAMQGGALYATGEVHLSSCTVTGNSGTTSGGIHVSGDGRVFLHNTILFGNTLPSSSGIGPECVGAVISSGFNLIGDTTGCTFSDASSDILGIDPALGLLEDNGGFTPTHGIVSGSAAHEAGDPNGCEDDDGPLPFDQRGEGFSRHIGRCDIGAFELQ